MTDAASTGDARAAVAAIEGVDGAAMARLETYAAMLRAENARQNLVAASTLEGDALWSRHLLDSAQLLALAPPPDSRGWVDVGSGPGLPGLVIAILAPRWRVTLVESRRLRCAFLRDCIAALDLGGQVDVLEMPVERVPPRGFAVISARAFAPLPRLLHVCRHLADNETIWLLPKGKNAVKEKGELPQAWQSMFHVKHSQTDDAAMILVGRGAFRTERRQNGRRSA